MEEDRHLVRHVRGMCFTPGMPVAGKASLSKLREIATLYCVDLPGETTAFTLANCTKPKSNPSPACVNSHTRSVVAPPVPK